jgi:pimeloyl-ACP methyl ester carboxylesterase
MNDTIFMIHGMWGGAWYWENYVNFFSEKGYRCVTTTLRYHDMEPTAVPDPRLGTTRLQDYAADLEAEIKALDGDPIIMGHSMGGLLAQMLGSRGLGSRLVLLTPAAPAGILALTPSVVRSFWSVMTKWKWWDKPTRQTFKEASYSMLHLFPETEQRAVYDRFVYESGRATFEIGFALLDRSKGSRVDESQVTAPMLVIGGKQDRITPVTAVKKVVKKYNADYQEFPDHAHWVVGEPGWQEVAEYVAGWLENG